MTEADKLNLIIGIATLSVMAIYWYCADGEDNRNEPFEPTVVFAIVIACAILFPIIAFLL